MNRLLRRPAALVLSVPGGVRAGERLPVTVRRADGRPLLGATVELVPARTGEPTRWPFRLRAPDPLPAPSVSTPQYTVRWLLRAVADRPLRPDRTTTVELVAGTAP